MKEQGEQGDDQRGAGDKEGGSTGGDVLEADEKADIIAEDAGGAQQDKRQPVAASAGVAGRPSVRRVMSSRVSEAMAKRRKAALAGATVSASILPEIKVPPQRSMVRVRER